MTTLARLLPLLLLLCLATCQPACTTVTPAAVHTQQASFDGTERNSGIVRYDAGLGGFVVTARFRARYNALIALYGDSRDALTGLPCFPAPLAADYGVRVAAGGEIILTPDAMAKMHRMSTWQKSGRRPQ